MNVCSSFVLFGSNFRFVVVVGVPVFYKQRYKNVAKGGEGFYFSSFYPVAIVK
jgi:hypothetical protein